MIDAREYLHSIRLADSRIQLKIQQVQRLKDRLLSVSMPADKEQVSHTKNVEIMAETIAMIVDKQKEIDQENKEITKQKCEVIELTCQMPTENAQILLDHFLEGKTIMAIGKEHYFSKRQAQRRVKKALGEFQCLLDEHEKEFLSGHRINTVSPVTIPQYYTPQTDPPE